MAIPFGLKSYYAFRTDQCTCYISATNGERSHLGVVIVFVGTFKETLMRLEIALRHHNGYDRKLDSTKVKILKR